MQENDVVLRNLNEKANEYSQNLLKSLGPN